MCISACSYKDYAVHEAKMNNNRRYFAWIYTVTLFMCGQMCCSAVKFCVCVCVCFDDAVSSCIHCIHTYDYSHVYICSCYIEWIFVNFNAAMQNMVYVCEMMQHIDLLIFIFSNDGCLLLVGIFYSHSSDWNRTNKMKGRRRRKKKNILKPHKNKRNNIRRKTHKKPFRWNSA